METQDPLERIVQQAKQYGKSSIELFRLKAIDKTADVLSSLVSKLFVIVYFILVFVLLNIGAALWIGDVLGKLYYGFIVVALFYSVFGIILYASRHTWLKDPTRNYIIVQLLK